MYFFLSSARSISGFVINFWLIYNSLSLVNNSLIWPINNAPHHDKHHPKNYLARHHLNRQNRWYCLGRIARRASTRLFFRLFSSIFTSKLQLINHTKFQRTNNVPKLVLHLNHIPHKLMSFKPLLRRFWCLLNFRTSINRDFLCKTSVFDGIFQNKLHSRIHLPFLYALAKFHVPHVNVHWLLTLQSSTSPSSLTTSAEILHQKVGLRFNLSALIST